MNVFDKSPVRVLERALGGGLVEVVGAHGGVGQHGDDVRHYFEDAAADEEEGFLAVGLLHAHRAGLELRDQRRVAGADAEFADGARGEDHRGLAGEDLLQGNQHTVGGDFKGDHITTTDQLIVEFDNFHTVIKGSI